METFFFLEITCFRSEKPLEFAISVGKPLAISVKTFFLIHFEAHPFLVGKPLEFAISVEKPLAISVKTFFFFFWRSPVFGRKNRLRFRFRQENPFDFLLLTVVGINFSCPCAPLEFTQNKLLEPPQSCYPGAGPDSP